MSNTIHDIKTCIEKLESFSIHDQMIEDVKMRLRRSLVEMEGIGDIWNDNMSDFEKACIMLDRGFKIEPASGKGVVISYLGYYLWDLTDYEYNMLICDEQKLNAWKNNWRCFRAFCLTLKPHVPNHETIKFAWCRLQIISEHESFNIVEHYSQKNQFPDMFTPEEKKR